MRRVCRLAILIAPKCAESASFRIVGTADVVFVNRDAIIYKAFSKQILVNQFSPQEIEHTMPLKAFTKSWGQAAVEGPTLETAADLKVGRLLQVHFLFGRVSMSCDPVPRLKIMLFVLPLRFSSSRVYSVPYHLHAIGETRRCLIFELIHLWESRKLPDFTLPAKETIPGLNGIIVRRS